MKKIIVVLSIVGLFFISCKEDKSKKTDTQDAKEVVKTEMVNNKYKVVSSKLTWKGYKPSGVHNGTIDLKEGVLNYDGNLKGGKFTFDMTSIKVLDIKDTKDNADLMGHLVNSDFFDVTQFPTGAFEITKVIKADITSTIEGNLTLKGITKSISFPASIIEKDGELTFLSNAIKIDRTDFGIKYKSKKFFDNLKDKFINDLFDITFEVKASK
ncbi:MAG: YceI family protein [Flavobacteriaceae bacterium]|nr:YceI family protein [Flavobacteriaceae bacterium]